MEHSFADKVFFCNSGAEANEAAIKLARKYAKEHLGKDKFEIITAVNSFHGRTLATVTATGQEKFQKGFEPLVPGFKHAAFNDISALESAITQNTCAVMLEPIQGEGGVNVPDNDYFKKCVSCAISIICFLFLMRFRQAWDAQGNSLLTNIFMLPLI